MAQQNTEQFTDASIGKPEMILVYVFMAIIYMGIGLGLGYWLWG